MVFNLRTFSFAESVEDDPTPPKSFSLKELRVATDNFSSSNISRDSLSGEVYRGRLTDGSLVEVKRVRHGDPWREELFDAEMQVGSTVSMHPNVLRLRGFCRTKKELLLVYPLMINNTLSYNLRERPDRFARPLNWTTRKRIALGAARGLAHLHNQGNIKTMHRDIRSFNILLNERFEAVIGGFSIAVIIQKGTIEWPTRMPRRATGVSISSLVEENSADSGSDFQSYHENSSDSGSNFDYHHYEDVYVDTNLCGTIGFIAPEYLDTRQCTLKNDVFAYGKMLLELISGQQLLLFPSDGEYFSLEDSVRKHMNEGQLGRVIDPNLQGNYVEEEAERLVGLALLCTYEDPSVRPEMSGVVRMLESKSLWAGS